MNDLEKLEKELSSLQPKSPSDQFSKKIESSLGEAGKVAMCHLQNSESGIIEKDQSISRFTKSSFVLGLAAIILLGFYLTIPSVIEDNIQNSELIDSSAIQQSSVAAELDSPLHGVSVDKLESFSGMPIDGWQDPFTEQRFILRVDEGLVDRMSGVPARQYRYHFVDETMWTHPASDTHVITTTPRQEVYLIDLELY